MSNNKHYFRSFCVFALLLMAIMMLEIAFIPHITSLLLLLPVMLLLPLYSVSLLLRRQTR